MILFAILTIVTFKSFGQKLQESTTDNVKRTSWETLFTSFTANAYFSISKSGDEEIFDLKFQDGKITSIIEGKVLSLKLDNGEVIKLINSKNAMSCTGCGSIGHIGSTAEGIEAFYPLSKENAETLKANKIVNVNIQTTVRDINNDVKEKNALKIRLP